MGCCWGGGNAKQRNQWGGELRGWGREGGQLAAAERGQMKKGVRGDTGNVWGGKNDDSGLTGGPRSRWAGQGKKPLGLRREKRKKAKRQGDMGIKFEMTAKEMLRGIPTKGGFRGEVRSASEVKLLGDGQRGVIGTRTGGACRRRQKWNLE